MEKHASLLVKVLLIINWNSHLLLHSNCPLVNTIILQLRTIYYVMMHLIQRDENAKEYGIITLLYAVGHSQFKFRQRDEMKLVTELMNSLPIKNVSNHVCTDDPTISLIMNTIRPLISNYVLSRHKIHCGTHLEIHYELLTYGIPVQVLPVNTDGQYSNANHAQWLQQRRSDEEQQNGRREENAVVKSHGESQLETSEQRAEGQHLASSTTMHYTAPSSVLPQAIPSSILSSPIPSSLRPPSIVANGSMGILGGGGIMTTATSKDVLLGRGSSTDNFSGNVQFRNFLRQHLQEYETTAKQHKTELASKLLHKLKTEGGVRFLKRTEDQQLSRSLSSNAMTSASFEVVDDVTARDKISRTLRRLREAKRHGY